ncbi:MAG: COX15/CtaA family protein, partial [Pyrinomonadaceae bacterium]
ARFAWFVLAYNLLVILWGVFLRASKSGDGCGQHWLTCRGEVVPSAPELKTIIEFSHRITSSLAGLLLIALLIWAIVVWYRQRSEIPSRILTMAAGSFVFVVIEGLLGAGLVLTGNTAENLTPERPFWMAAHLINTLILLAFLTLTAWFASGGKRLRFDVELKYLAVLLISVVGILCIGMSGSIAALSSMIFPSGTLAEGLAKDFSPTSNMLLRLRLLHPLLSILTGVFLIFVAGWLRRRSSGDATVARLANILSILIVVQIAFGAVTLLTLAPIVMQLGHLFLADSVWISFVLLSASFLGKERELA